MGTFARYFAAALVAVYAGLAAYLGSRLPHTGAVTLLGPAVALAAVAIGLAARQFWAWVFALTFLGVTAVAYGIACVVFLFLAVPSGSMSGQAGLSVVVFGALAFVSLLGAGLSAPAAILLWRNRSSISAAPRGMRTLSVAGAVGAVVIIGWLIGHDYVYRELPRQNDCMSGVGAQCTWIARMPERFTHEERVAFARRGCEERYDEACRELVRLLERRHTVATLEVRALVSQCEFGKPQLCERVGLHLLRIGEREAGARYLGKACELDKAWCEPSADAAKANGVPDLAMRLLEDGCAADNVRSCRKLLRQREASATPPEDIERLAWKLCLIGDVNDCRPLMRRDLAAACERICQGATESRMHTCVYCAEDADKLGQPELARSWLAQTCGHGYKWGCERLMRDRR